MEYLNEERYQQSNRKVKKIGKVLLIVGIVVLVLSFFLTVFGFLGFGNSAMNNFETFETFDPFGNNVSGMKDIAGGFFGSFGMFALGGFMSTLGFGLTIAGALVMFVAHRREITAYTTQQVMPIAQEGIEKMAPTLGKAAGEIAKGIKEGLNDANNE